MTEDIGAQPEENGPGTDRRKRRKARFRGVRTSGIKIKGSDLWPISDDMTPVVYPVLYREVLSEREVLKQLHADIAALNRSFAATYQMWGNDEVDLSRTTFERALDTLLKCLPPEPAQYGARARVIAAQANTQRDPRETAEGLPIATLPDTLSTAAVRLVELTERHAATIQPQHKEKLHTISATCATLSAKLQTAMQQAWRPDDVGRGASGREMGR